MTATPKPGDIVIYFSDNSPYLAQFRTNSKWEEDKWLYLTSDIPSIACTCKTSVNKLSVIKNVPETFKQKYFHPDTDFIYRKNDIQSALEELYIICANKIKSAWLNRYYSLHGKGYNKCLSNWNKNNSDLEQIKLQI